MAALLAAGGFAGGVLPAKHEGVTATTRVRAALRRHGRHGQLIDGDTIYVTTTDGSVVKVTTSGTTKLSVAATAKASDIKPGQTIVAQGTTEASGNVTTTSVNESTTTG